MVFHLQNILYEKVQAAEYITDKDLIDVLRKEKMEINLRDLNKALLHLEILGLVSVRWSGKNKRRIEVSKRELEKPRTFW